MNNKKYSPNYKNFVELTFIGEIRFGPEYFRLKINNKNLNNRIFGDKYRWSENDNYFAIEEWLNTEYSTGPITKMTIFDLNNDKEYSTIETKGAFVYPILFEKACITYEINNKAANTTINKELKLDDSIKWHNIKLNPKSI